VTEEYCWAITQAVGQSCCGRSGSTVLDLGLRLNSLVCRCSRPRIFSSTYAKFDLGRMFLNATAYVGECLHLVWRICQNRILDDKSHSRIIISGKKKMAKSNSRRQPHSGKNIWYGKEASSRKYVYYVRSEKDANFCSRRHNHGGINIIPGVEEMPTPNA